MSVNKVILVGNVGRDPEVRYLESNTKVATFTLATSERYRDRNGEQKENTEWHNIVAWRQTADVCEKFVRKGTQVYIEGKLRTRSYADAQGVKKYTTEIQVDTLQLLGRREGEGAPAPTQAPAYGGYQQPAYQQAPAYQQPAAPAFQQPQSPAQPAYQQPVYNAPAAPAAPVVDDMPGDDLPF